MDDQVAIDFYAARKSRNEIAMAISEAISEKRSVTNICDTMDLGQMSQSQNVSFTDIPLTKMSSYKINEGGPLKMHTQIEKSLNVIEVEEQKE